MYGSSQKSRIFRYLCFTTLFVYLFLSSQNISFFVVNFLTIALVTFVLKGAKSQIVSALSILVYSVVIDIVCYLFFPLFPIFVPLGTYIVSGLLFNLNSAIVPLIIALCVIVAKFIIPKLVQKKPSLRPALGTFN